MGSFSDLWPFIYLLFFGSFVSIKIEEKKKPNRNSNGKEKKNRIIKKTKLNDAIKLYSLAIFIIDELKILFIFSFHFFLSLSLCISIETYTFMVST